MHLAPISPAYNGMPELMKSLDEDQPQIEQKQIVGREDALGLLHSCIKAIEHKFGRRSDHRQPQDRAHGTDQEFHDGHEAPEKVVRIQEWNAHEHDAH